MLTDAKEENSMLKAENSIIKEGINDFKLVLGAVVEK